MTDLAVAIVSWNNADVIADALQSLIDDLRDSGLEYEIWLVDSASGDRTVDIVREGFSRVKLIACEENIGFGAANNLALRSIGFTESANKDEFPAAVYFLNPDTVTHRGASRQLYDTLTQRDDVGLVGARLTFG